jgi:hypothetical protein
MTERVGTYQTIDVSIQIEGTEKSGTSRAVAFSFVFGIGTAGISSFERALEGAAVGDTIFLDLTPAGVTGVFGPLAHRFFAAAGPIPDESTLRVTVERIAPTAPREMIKALAENAACGCDCCG